MNLSELERRTVPFFPFITGFKERNTYSIYSRCGGVCFNILLISFHVYLVYFSLFIEDGPIKLNY